jgi:hypothetical protein
MTTPQLQFKLWRENKGKDIIVDPKNTNTVSTIDKGSERPGPSVSVHPLFECECGREPSTAVPVV